MSFDWSEYLNLAQELAGQAVSPASQEARLRASISRAYYAAFCKSRNYLRDKEGRRVPSGVRAHRFVQDEFKRSSDRVRKQIGYDLDRLRSDRNKADYDDSIVNLSVMTTVDLALANRVISTLDRL
jgi:uncharacterized protein (UPF0332 family)